MDTLTSRSRKRKVPPSHQHTPTPILSYTTPPHTTPVRFSCLPSPPLSRSNPINFARAFSPLIYPPPLHLSPPPHRWQRDKETRLEDMFNDPTGALQQLPQGVNPLTASSVVESSKQSRKGSRPSSSSSSSISFSSSSSSSSLLSSSSFSSSALVSVNANTLPAGPSSAAFMNLFAEVYPLLSS